MLQHARLCLPAREVSVVHLLLREEYCQQQCQGVGTRDACLSVSDLQRLRMSVQARALSVGRILFGFYHLPDSTAEPSTSWSTPRACSCAPSPSECLCIPDARSSLCLGGLQIKGSTCNVIMHAST